MKEVWYLNPRATCLGWTMDPPLWSPDDTGHRSGPCYVGAPPTPGPQPTYYSLSTGTAQTETVFRETAENGNLMRDRSGARTTHPHILTRCLVELQTKVREYFTITEKAPTRAFSLLKAPTSAFTLKTLSRHLC